jgi:anti-sigma factor RsiW
MVMDRKQFEDILADYLGNELSPRDRRAFEEHLAHSAEDRAEVEALQAAVRCLRELPPPPVAATGASEPGARARRLPQALVVRYLFRPLAYAAVLLAGVGIGWFARPAQRTTQPGAESPTATTVDQPSGPHVPDTKTPSRFVRNMYAMSVAFSRPTEQQVPSPRTGG